jgi:acyl-CoA thioesterase-2
VNLFRGAARGHLAARVRRPGGRRALVAACRTVDVAERPPHSLHAYFLLPGDPKVPIIYDVDRIRDSETLPPGA